MGEEDFGLTVVLYGPSGCGKSTIARRLEKCGFTRIMQLTTREPGYIQGSQPGVIMDERKMGEYAFVSYNHFMKLFDKGMFAEMMSFDKIQNGTQDEVFYGSLTYEYLEPGYHVVTTNIEGAAQLACESAIEESPLHGRLIFVEISVPIGPRLLKACDRERDNLDEVFRRAVNEKRLYYTASKWDIFPQDYFPDMILHDDEFPPSVEEFLFGRWTKEMKEDRWSYTRCYWYTDAKPEDVSRTIDGAAEDILEYISNRIGSEGSEV